MSYLSAALEVLGASETPLTAREVAQHAIERGLIVPKGKTPWRTMDSVLYCAVRDDPGGPVQRDFVPGVQRAQRGSVRWTVRR